MKLNSSLVPDFLKVYYRQEPERSDLERKVSERFGCSIEDLDVLLAPLRNAGSMLKTFWTEDGFS